MKEGKSVRLFLSVPSFFLIQFQGAWVNEFVPLSIILYNEESVDLILKWPDKTGSPSGGAVKWKSLLNKIIIRPPL